MQMLQRNAHSASSRLEISDTLQNPAVVAASFCKLKPPSTTLRFPTPSSVAVRVYVTLDTMCAYLCTRMSLHNHRV